MLLGGRGEMIFDIWKVAYFGFEGKWSSCATPRSPSKEKPSPPVMPQSAFTPFAIPVSFGPYLVRIAGLTPWLPSQ